MKRRKAREYALQFLYRIDFVEPLSESIDLSKLTDELYGFLDEVGEQDPGTRSFTREVVKGTVANLREIDALISKIAEKWKLSRMASIDRNIMRFAAYELLFRNDIPPAVTMNEALEIAKKFSTAESASFINGILDKIAKDFRKGSSEKQCSENKKAIEKNTAK